MLCVYEMAIVLLQFLSVFLYRDNGASAWSINDLNRTNNFLSSHIVIEEQCTEDGVCENNICGYFGNGVEKICAKKCYEDDDCGNLHKCVGNGCVRLCSTDGDCENHMKCQETLGHKVCFWKRCDGNDDCEKSLVCAYDGQQEKGACIRECDCGAKGICRFENGKKKCDCDSGFVENKGTCTDCICKGGACEEENGKTVCKCPPGFGNYTSASCKACDCGPDTNCIWKGIFGGSKICLCKPGYSTKKGKCVACECGPDSNCEWISDGWLKSEKKVCHCKTGYHEKDGKCVDTETSSRGTIESFVTSTPHSSTGEDCHCGSFSYSCSLDSAGNKVCNCFMGYSQLDGSCAECNCGPYGTCTFEHGRKKCNCKPNATQMNGNCLDKQDLRTFFLNLLEKFS